MKIAYYMPFKPLGHPNPSGDLIIGTELFEHFHSNHHDINLISEFRSRWLYHKPHLWPGLIREYLRINHHLQTQRPQLWLTYHSYYKAPDMLGPYCSKALLIPYVIFQGIYSTKQRRKLKTLPGFLLNRHALQAAQMVFTNKRQDEKNLKRLLPHEKITFIPPGIKLQEFQFSPAARRELREQWQVQDKTVIMSAAMFRPGVKTQGILTVIDACQQLLKAGRNIQLVIAGAGSSAAMLKNIAAEKLGEAVLFLGKLERVELHRYYSAADLFVFPGIDESLGMVYLEAQSCRLPVIAFEDWGASTAVIHNQTGLLSPAKDPEQFIKNIDTLVHHQQLRESMATNAQAHIRLNHDLEKNYSIISDILYNISKT